MPRVEYRRLLGRFMRSVFLSVRCIPRGGFGSAASKAVFLIGFVILQSAHWVALLLDEVLFPAFRKVEVREPLFIVGMPRTGTSFLQQVLSDDDERFTTLRLWELVLAPSVTERLILKGLIGMDRRIGRPIGRLVEGSQNSLFRWMESVHPVRFDNPEEDYLFLLPAFACFLLVLPFPDHSRVWDLARFDDLPRAERDAIVGFFRSCVQRHLYVESGGRRLLSKNPSFTPMVRSLASAFPDARFLCCLRDPVESVPSLLNSMQSGADFFGWDMRDPAYADRFVGMLEYFAFHSIETFDAFEPERYAFVPLPKLRGDVRDTVTRIYGRFGWVPGDRFLESLAASTETGRKFRSRHTYALVDFGLTADGVRARFRGILERLEREIGPDVVGPNSMRARR